MANSSLIQLIAMGKMDEHLKNPKCVNSLTTYNFNKIDNKYLHTLFRGCDVIKEIFLVIKLDKLPDNNIWDDNLVSKLINKIEIDIIGYKVMEFTGNYIEMINNIWCKSYPDQLLYRNLTHEQKIILSKNGVELYIPLHIKRIMQYIPMISLPFNEVKINLFLNPINKIMINVNDPNISLMINESFLDIDDRNILYEKKYSLELMTPKYHNFKLHKYNYVHLNWKDVRIIYIKSSNEINKLLLNNGYPIDITNKMKKDDEYYYVQFDENMIVEMLEVYVYAKLITDENIDITADTFKNDGIILDRGFIYV